MPDQPKPRFTRDDLRAYAHFAATVVAARRTMHRQDYTITKYRAHLVALIHILDKELHRVGGSVK